MLIRITLNYCHLFGFTLIFFPRTPYFIRDMLSTFVFVFYLMVPFWKIFGVLFFLTNFPFRIILSQYCATYVQGEVYDDKIGRKGFNLSTWQKCFVRCLTTLYLRPSPPSPSLWWQSKESSVSLNHLAAMHCGVINHSQAPILRHGEPLLSALVFCSVCCSLLLSYVSILDHYRGSSNLYPVFCIQTRKFGANLPKVKTPFSHLSFQCLLTLQQNQLATMPLPALIK